MRRLRGRKVESHVDQNQRRLLQISNDINNNNNTHTKKSRMGQDGMGQVSR